MKMPSASALSNELQKATNIGNFLKMNKRNLIVGSLADHLNQLLTDKDITGAERGARLLP
jgi:hypothetical protein